MGAFEVTVWAADTHGGVGEHVLTLQVDTGIPFNSVPESMHTMVIGEEFCWDVDSDAEGMAGSTYSLSLAPDWLTIDPNTGLMSGTPTRWWHVSDDQLAIVRMDAAAGEYGEHAFRINVLGHVFVIEAAARKRNTSFRDADSDLVKVNLMGRVGRVVLVRAIEPGADGYSPAQPGDLFSIEFDESDHRTGLSMRVRRNRKAGGDGQTTLERVFGASPVRLLAATKTQLVGAGIEMIGQGYIRRLKLLDILGGADVIMPGTGATKGLFIKTGRIGHETDIILGSGIKTLNSLEYLGGSVVAPWAVRVITRGRRGRTPIRGDFGADLILTERSNVPGGKHPALRQMRVAGFLYGASIHTVGSVGIITAGAMIDSSLYVGLQSSFGSGLPSEQTDFLAMPEKQMPTLRLKLRKTKGLEYSFVNSNICVWNLGNVIVDLGRIQTGNNGAEFGIVGRNIESYRSHRDRKLITSSSEMTGATEVHRVDDFVVKLI